MQNEIITYAADGLGMAGQLIRPVDEDSGKLGVAIFPDAFGLGDHALDQAARFARLGHTVLACDLHGGGLPMNDLPAVLDFVGRIQQDAGAMRARAMGGIEALGRTAGLAPHRIVAVGYCLGGTLALELARAGAPIAGAIGLHCGLQSPRPAPGGSIHAKILVCLGADDPVVSASDRGAFENEMRESGADWQLHLYGGVVHSFTDPSVDHLNQPQVTRYDPQADARSWQAIERMLAELE